MLSSVNAVYTLKSETKKYIYDLVFKSKETPQMSRPSDSLKPHALTSLYNICMYM